MANKIDRAKVKEVFTFTRSYSMVGWGVALAILALVMSNARGLNNLSPILLLIAVVMIVVGFLRNRRTIDKAYEELQRAKREDLTKLVQRSFNQINVPVDELLNFEADDLIDLGLGAERGNVLAQLENRSVRLFGLPERNSLENLRYIRAGKATLVEYNPIQVSVLYLTRDRLIRYNALLDVTRGDLNSESTDHTFLRDVVQIGTMTETDRYTETNHAVLFKSYKEARGSTPSELVVRRHTVRISTTDGRSVVLPIGAPEVEDGSRGALDRPETGDNKYTTIAHQMSARIRDVKAS